MIRKPIGYYKDGAAGARRTLEESKRKAQDLRRRVAQHSTNMHSAMMREDAAYQRASEAANRALLARRAGDEAGQRAAYRDLVKHNKAKRRSKATMDRNREKYYRTKRHLAGYDDPHGAERLNNNAIFNSALGRKGGRRAHLVTEAQREAGRQNRFERKYGRRIKRVRASARSDVQPAKPLSWADELLATRLPTNVKPRPIKPGNNSVYRPGGPGSKRANQDYQDDIDSHYRHTPAHDEYGVPPHPAYADPMQYK